MLNIGSMVYNARRMRDVSQDELCAATGISRTMLSYIENGKRTPSIEMLDKLAKALGCTLAISFDNIGKISEVDLKGIFD